MIRESAKSPGRHRNPPSPATRLALTEGAFDG